MDEIGLACIGGPVLAGRWTMAPARPCYFGHGFKFVTLPKFVSFYKMALVKHSLNLPCVCDF